MSTIGENTQSIPSDDASSAAARAVRFTRSVSHEQASPSGMGNIVRCPCITSCPKISGIPSRELRKACVCTSMRSSSDPTLNNPPTTPRAIFSLTPLLFSTPVWRLPSQVSRFICPTFSSRVIRPIRLSMNLSISVFPEPPAARAVPASAIVPKTAINRNLTFISGFCFLNYTI